MCYNSVILLVKEKREYLQETIMYPVLSKARSQTRPLCTLSPRPRVCTKLQEPFTQARNHSSKKYLSKSATGGQGKYYIKFIFFTKFKVFTLIVLSWLSENKISKELCHLTKLMYFVCSRHLHTPRRVAGGLNLSIWTAKYQQQQCMCPIRIDFTIYRFRKQEQTMRFWKQVTKSVSNFVNRN